MIFPFVKLGKVLTAKPLEKTGLGAFGSNKDSLRNKSGLK